MGLSTEYLAQGQDAHAAEFMCAICCNLVDAPLLTQCQHVFCTSCLQDWFDRISKCPTCSTPLDPRHGAGELKLASPFAWRVLGRLQMKCPLLGPHGAPCGWRGEYSELTSHMTSSDSHQAPAPAAANGDVPMPDSQQTKDSALAQAEALKQAGNGKFEQRIYADAIALYTKAIGLAPDVATYYLNRAAAHLQNGAHADCVADCQASLARDGTNPKAHKRLAKALIEQGEFDKAVNTLRSASGAAPAAAGALKADLDAAVELQQWMREGQVVMPLPPSLPSLPSLPPFPPLPPSLLSLLGAYSAPCAHAPASARAACRPRSRRATAGWRAPSLATRCRRPTRPRRGCGSCAPSWGSGCATARSARRAR